MCVGAGSGASDPALPSAQLRAPLTQGGAEKGPKSHPRLHCSPCPGSSQQLDNAVSWDVCGERNTACGWKLCWCVWSSEIKLPDLVFCHQFTPYSTDGEIFQTWLPDSRRNQAQVRCCQQWLVTAWSPPWRRQDFFRRPLMGWRKGNQGAGTSSKKDAEGTYS